jgi:peptidyl-dipeptidase A
VTTRTSAVRLGSLLALVIFGCAAPRGRATGEPTRPAQGVSTDAQQATAEEADQFVREVNGALRELYVDSSRRSWVKATYVTHDTELLAAEGFERVTEYLTRKIRQARRFDGLALSPATRRSLYLLRFSAGLPAPEAADARKELSQLATRLESVYSTGKYCSPKLKGLGRDKNRDPRGAPDDGCRDLLQLSRILAEQRNWDVLLEAWQGWHSIARPMRPLYERMVTLGNQGARELGFADMAEIWTGGYDMSSAEFTRDIDRLWEETKPLYEQLHCYTRARLRQHYGKSRVPEATAIPAHLLGNMWAQQWDELYPWLEPFPGKGTPDLTRRLVQQGYGPVKMVRLAENFFTSLGMDPLPSTFWERSLFEKPRDREVECHASAWSIDLDRDLRIKMCIEVQRRLSRRHRRYARAECHAFVPQADRAAAERRAVTGSRPQSADVPGAERGGISAVWKADRQLAARGVLGRDQSRRVQCGVVATARTVSRRGGTAGSQRR